MNVSLQGGMNVRRSLGDSELAGTELTMNGLKGHRRYRPAFSSSGFNPHGENVSVGQSPPKLPQKVFSWECFFFFYVGPGVPDLI